MRTTGDVYLWPTAAERKLRMAYQAGLPAYLYGVTGVGKTSLIRHFLEKKEYFYVSALNTTPDDLVWSELGDYVREMLRTEREDG